MSLFSSVSLAPQPEIPVHLSTCTILGGPTESQNPEVLGAQDLGAGLPGMWAGARHPHAAAPDLPSAHGLPLPRGAGGGQEGPQQRPGGRPTAQPSSCRGRWAAAPGGHSSGCGDPLPTPTPCLLGRQMVSPVTSSERAPEGRDRSCASLALGGDAAMVIRRRRHVWPVGPEGRGGGGHRPGWGAGKPSQ